MDDRGASHADDGRPAQKAMMPDVHGLASIMGTQAPGGYSPACDSTRARSWEGFSRDDSPNSSAAFERITRPSLTYTMKWPPSRNPTLRKESDSTQDRVVASCHGRVRVGAWVP